jgi:hypothetical protein
MTRFPGTDPERPPVPPGEGLFRIKGTAYIGHLHWADEHFPGGRKALAAELSPPMRTFFEQSFLAMSFFDLMPLVCASHTCARLLGKSFEDWVEGRSRQQAALDLNGVHRALLKLGSPRLIGARIPILMSQYFDFGTTRLIATESYRIRFEIANVPVLFADWLHAVYEGFGSAIIQATGGIAPNVEVERETTGLVHGFPACRLTCNMQWS